MDFFFSKAVFGILSSFFVLIGSLPYLIDIHKKRVRPHVLSWIGWAFITALGASAMLAGGSTWAVAILLANASILYLSLYILSSKKLEFGLLVFMILFSLVLVF
jgi:hypothetical protein